MTSNHISEPVKKWLQDETFVLWCLAPTPESDAWWHDYVAAHPEEYAHLAEAREILLLAKLNPAIRTPEESKKLWNRIENSMERKENRRRMLTFTRYAAACILALGIIGFWTFRKKQPIIPEQALIVSIQPDSLQTEITLIKDNTEIIEIENNTVIAYDSAITIQSPKQKATILQTVTEKKKTEHNTLVVPRGRRTSLLLADGSRVWVNSGTTLHFPSDFDANERKIKVEGEIYIEVARDASRPFYVETPQMTVNVLGTKFNISAYANDASQSVVLVEGSIRVNTQSAKSFTLRPNQRFSINPEFSGVDEVDVYDYISWIDGVLQFRGETMEEITQRLSRYYNIPISCSPEMAQKRTVGKLMLFDNIEQVMKTFAMLYDIKYTIDTERITIE